jgi:lactate dehydrogenase-like 2-hydroxyacid dehydrogenase
MGDIDILLPARMNAKSEAALDAAFRVHRPFAASDPNALIAGVADRIRGIARYAGGVDAAMIDRFPRLEIISSFGVGYDPVDAVHAGRRGVIVTNTPDVLTEEVADTTLGLLLMTVRELSAAERYLREGKWRQKMYRLTPNTLRDRTVGIIGLGRIGLAVARRLVASEVPVVYHNRHPRPDAPYKHYPDLIQMAREVDTLISVLPGGAATNKLIGAEVLEALGPRGIVINIGRGTVVDDDALIAALKERRIAAAGLDVFVREPEVPAGYLELDNVVLLPHVGSASEYTRAAMEAMVVDNLLSWFRDGKPLTPVPETPWPRA